MKLFIAIATTLLLFGCSRADPSATQRTGGASTWYRAVVASDDHVEAVFLLRVPAGKGTASFKVGEIGRAHV